MYEVIVDGNSVQTTTNSRPKKYKNVKVWAAHAGFRYPAADAKIKNLKASKLHMYYNIKY